MSVVAMNPRISRGRINDPLFVVVYGPDGVGKTEFGAGMPDVIFCGPERGSNRVRNNEVSRFEPATSYDEFVSDLKWLADTEHPYKSVVVDSLTALEPLVWAKTCKRKGWPDIEDPGFGKGYIAALDEWKEIMALLNRLRFGKRMEIVLIGHSYVKTFNDPAQALPYDRTMLRLNDKAAAYFRENTDATLFINYETFVKKENRHDRKGKGYDSGEDKRIVCTTRRPAYDAKNRFALPPEYELAFPNGYAQLKAFIDADGGQGAEELYKQLLALKEEVKDAEKKPVIDAAIAKMSAASPVNELRAYYKRLVTLVESQQSEQKEVKHGS